MSFTFYWFSDGISFNNNAFPRVPACQTYIGIFGVLLGIQSCRSRTLLLAYLPFDTENVSLVRGATAGISFLKIFNMFPSVTYEQGILYVITKINLYFFRIISFLYVRYIGTCLRMHLKLGITLH